MTKKKIYCALAFLLILFLLLPGVNAIEDGLSDSKNTGNNLSYSVTNLEEISLDDNEREYFKTNLNENNPNDNNEREYFKTNLNENNPNDNIEDSNLKNNNNKTKLEASSKGEYLNVSEAYSYLNKFRTEGRTWYWNYDDTSKTFFNSNDTIWLKPLERDAALEETAKIRAKEISERFSHYRSDGSICFTIFPEDLLDYGENIASGYKNYKEATEGWKESNETYSGQGHRRNMLEPNYNCVGIAAYKVNGTIYWVQDFGLKDNPKSFNSSNSFLFTNNSKNPEFKLNMPVYASGIFNVKVDGKNIMNATVFQGKSSIMIYGLSAGTHSVELSYGGDCNYKAASKTALINVLENKDLPEVPSFSYLNTFIQMADDEITLDRDYAYDSKTDSLFRNGICISRPLTVYGQGHKIDGKDMARIFNVTTYDVNLVNLTFTNGKSDDEGGAIYSAQDVKIINSSFFNNSARYGGAVYCDDYYHVYNSSFIGNSAERGGALYHQSYVRNSSFVNNYASDLGGAVYSPYTSFISGSNFTNNSNIQVFLNAYGSNNIFNNDEYSELFYNASINNGTVSLNQNYNASQTILINGSNVVIEGNGYEIDAKSKFRIFYITGDNVTIRNLKLINGYSTNEGGAIYSDYSHIFITGSSFENNTADKGGTVNAHGSELKIIDSSFNNNNALDFSGEEMNQGGCIFIDNANLLIKNSSFINNTASYGGTVHSEYGSVQIQDSVFINNDASLYAGGVVHANSDIYVSNSTFRDNDAPRYGGAIFAYENATISISDSSFTNNTSRHYGGAISAADGLDISNSTFIANRALDMEGNGSIEGMPSNFVEVCEGGVISAWCEVTIKNSRFINNTAELSAVMYLYSIDNNVTIISSSFINNTALNSFGALDITSNALIINSSFINNTAQSGSAGAIGNYQNMSIVNSTFIDNFATGGEDGSEGGAILNYGNNALVKDSAFINNHADKGGAIHNPTYANLSVRNATFINNSANDGGAINQNDDWYYEKYVPCTPYVADSIFINNTALNGGAINNRNSSFKVVNSDFRDNYASSGGTIKSNSGTLSLINSSVKYSNEIDAIKGSVNINKTKILENEVDVTKDYINHNRKDNNSTNSADSIPYSEISSDSKKKASKIIYSNMDTAPVNLSKEGRIGDYFVVKLVDEDGKALAGLPISIGFNGKIYNRLTSSNGVAILQINLAKEEIYTFAICFLGDDDYFGSFEVAKITVNKKNKKPNKANEKSLGNYANKTKITRLTETTIKYSDMNTKSVYAGDGRIGEYFKVTLLDQYGRILSGHPIKIGFNGKIYDRKTSSDGSASLQINLPRATTYTFAIAYLGDKNHQGKFAVAKITVKAQSPKLTASSKTFKAKAKSKVISASLKTAKGNPIKSKLIKFTINGKTYDAKTNSKGLASVKVSLSKKGTYFATAKYVGDSTFKATTTYFLVRLT